MYFQTFERSHLIELLSYLPSKYRCPHETTYEKYQTIKYTTKEMKTISQLARSYSFKSDSDMEKVAEQLKQFNRKLKQVIKYS